ncbi:DUF6869 domain-containing protein [Phenylobacterium kunshanense]|uniref:DUF6869 domain-containing protein n=1 Tax=Phenylobacterium kunshanense TaxID=1445034 RepID=A0A328BHE2_9CAUL|nr:hypothetical protein [Phenylobacterium kunshanense]RAK66367.1 hypothetical protein DJ019_08965 [Phenylobacterium kunshanense]
MANYFDGRDDAHAAIYQMADTDPAQFWMLLKSVRTARLSELQLVFLAAGPFEEFLRRHGRSYAGPIVRAAEADESLRFLLQALGCPGPREELGAQMARLYRNRQSQGPTSRPGGA